MEKLKRFVESKSFNNFILGVIVFNSITMGLETSQEIVTSTGPLIAILDNICLAIFCIEIILKLIVYKASFFKSGWNIFDFVIVAMSLLSALSFLSTFRVFRIFRIFRSLRALKSLRAFRLVSGIERMRIIVVGISRAIPGVIWSMLLLLLIFYIFAIMGVTLFGSSSDPSIHKWFGNIPEAMYTLFQVMTLESWSMGIARPVMELYPLAWLYFVPFVLISAFIVMNVVVGIVVNAISEVTTEKVVNDKLGIDESEESEEAEEVTMSSEEYMLNEIKSLKDQMDRIEALLRE